MDEENAEKFARQGTFLTSFPLQVDQVLDSPFLHHRNRRGRRAARLVVGRDARDHGGQCIVIPVEPTGTLGVWRPVTAWRCDETYETRLKRERI